MFTNIRQLWHPPGARGVYGGAVIAQCLSAAQETVPDGYLVHSMHCYFVLAGNSDIPIIYHVERVRTGRSFATRTVQARQRDVAIFTTTLSFMREGSGGAITLNHNAPMPDTPAPLEDETEAIYVGHGPFESQHHDTVPDDVEPHAVRTRCWLRARGKISDQGGYRAHLNALAYMSDSFFIGTVARAHRTYRKPPKTDKSSDRPQDKSVAKRFKSLNGGHEDNVEQRPEIGMMVSLDHTIFFHNPKNFRADEWLLSEMHSPWVSTQNL